MRGLGTTVVFSAVLVVLPIAGCGGGGDDVATPGAEGVVDLTMRDNRFEPDRIRVDAGQAVVFRFANDGSLVHEAYFGDEAAQDAHEQQMTSATLPGHDAVTDGEGEHGALRVHPGSTGTVEQTFGESATVLLGCHEPGHWEAGMRATVEVA